MSQQDTSLHPFKPTVENVSEMLSIPIPNMISLYMSGSRLYGNNRENSDYDLFLIVTDETDLPKITENTSQEWVHMEEDEIMLDTLSKIQNSENVNEHEFQISKNGNEKFKRDDNCISYRSNIVDINIYKEGQFVYELENYMDCSIFEYASLSHYNFNNNETIDEITNINVNSNGSNLNLVRNAILLQNRKYLIPLLDTPEKKSAFRRPFSRKSANSYIKCKKKLCVEKDLITGLKSMFHSLRILTFAIQILKFGHIKDFSQANEYFHDIVTRNMETDISEGDAGEKLWNELDDKYNVIKKNLEKEFHMLAPKIGIKKPQKKPTPKPYNKHVIRKDQE